MSSLMHSQLVSRAHFPVFPTPHHVSINHPDVDVQIPTFSLDNCHDVFHIGHGTFGAVYRCTYEGRLHVVKKLSQTDDDDDDEEQRLFLKELMLLDRLRGHPNVVAVAAYCLPKRSLLMEYVSFSLECINLNVEPVHSLDKLLKSLLPGRFVGCGHLAYSVAMDVAVGLQFLHSKGIVHRDLKSANVLVSNSHYAGLCKEDVQKWWLVRPVVCKLTDFGESRSAAVKTKLQTTSTITRNVARGSPVYQAPEIYIGSKAGIGIAEYKQMDIWSFAIILFDLMNPHTYAYKEELLSVPASHSVQTFLTEKHKNKVLPVFSDRFHDLQQSVWQPLRNVFGACAVYLPRKRPSAKDIVSRLTNEHVNIHSLPVSQSTVAGHLKHARRKGRVSTRNACSFLCVIIADRLLKNLVLGVLANDEQQEKRMISEVCTDAITKFPEEVNSRRDPDQIYGIQEAYDIVRSAKACDEYDINVAIFSQSSQAKPEALEELRMCLNVLMRNERPFTAIYIMPPVTVLLCSLSAETLLVVDTHPVPKLNGGDDEHGMLVTSKHSETAVTAISNWLFNRLCTSQFVQHELVVLSPTTTAAAENSEVVHDVDEPVHSLSTDLAASDVVLHISSSADQSTVTGGKQVLEPVHTSSRCAVFNESSHHVEHLTCSSVDHSAVSCGEHAFRNPAIVGSVDHSAAGSVNHISLNPTSSVNCQVMNFTRAAVLTPTVISNAHAARSPTTFHECETVLRVTSGTPSLNTTATDTESMYVSSRIHGSLNLMTLVSHPVVSSRHVVVNSVAGCVKHTVRNSASSMDCGTVTSGSTTPRVLMKPTISSGTQTGKNPSSSALTDALDLSQHCQQIDNMNMYTDSIALDMSCRSTSDALCTAADSQQAVDFEVDDTGSSEQPVNLSRASQGVSPILLHTNIKHDTEAADELITDNEIQGNDDVSLSADTNDACILRQKIAPRFSTIYSRAETWGACPEQVVKSLPRDIDGLQKYVIICSMEDMMNVTKDGRPWAVWVTTSRKGFSGRRRMAKCRGSLQCVSEMCSFRAAHNRTNKVQFVKRDGNMVCFSCGSLAEHLSCPAVKIWEYHTDLQSAVVYHHGLHNCESTVERPNPVAIRNAIKKYPRTSAVQILHNELADCLQQDDVTEEDLEKVYNDFGSLRHVRQFQQTARQEDRPCGDGFDAVVHFKEKVNHLDKFLVYALNGRSMNNRSAYVFKSSIDMAQLAIEMDFEGTGFLRQEFAFVDVKHDRCREYKTATLWTYHPSMRKLLRLAVMDIEEENTENLTLFWCLFNQMLQEVKGQSSYKFNPIGFIADEHHANFKAIREVFGEAGAKRIKTCEFHYKQSVERHMTHLDVQFRLDFKKLAYDMLEAQSRADCEVACLAMSSFCRKHAHLVGWYEWWSKRKEHIFRAFKPTNTPHANIAEVGHAQMAAWAHSNTTLLQAAIDDVAQAVRQKHDLKAFLKGKHTGGTGISVNRRRAKQHVADMKRAEACARQLASDFESEVECTYIPDSGIHRPGNRRKKVRTAKAAKPAIRITFGANMSLSGNRTRMALRSVRKRSVRLPPAESENVSGNSGVSNVESTPRTTVNNQADDKTFQVVFCSPAIKTCYGCHQPFRNKYRREPTNVILKVMCHRVYTNALGQRVTSWHRQAAYFHLNLKCMRNYSLHATYGDVIVHDDVHCKLSDEQMELLHSFGVKV